MEIPRSGQYPRAVLFDLDGTLVDPAGGITGGIERALRLHGLAVPEPSELASLVGPPLAQGLEEIARVPADRVPAVIAEYRSWYAEEGMARSRVYPGITDVLAELKRAGVALAVSTSKPEAMAKRLLAMHGLDVFFDAVAGTQDNEAAATSHGKDGSKEHLVRRAAGALGIDPRESAVVGDRRFDILAALATGARAVGAGWGFAPADELAVAGAHVEVKHPTELLAALSGTEEA